MPAATAAPGPLRRVVALLQDNIQRLELQRNKPKTANQNEPKNGERPENLPVLLEYTWDLTKQVMGIAVLSENEAKKQARKDTALRKAQDLQLVHNVLLIMAVMEQMDDPVTRADFISGNCGAAQLAPEDIQILDKIYPEISSKPVTEDGTPPFEAQTMDSAKHMMSIIDGDANEIVGTTYAHIKEIISTINQCGYFDHPREAAVEEVEIEQVIPVREEPPVEVEPVPVLTPLVPVNPPPPAPQAVPAPVFSIITPRAPPVTLQQVEHAYFAQYNHPQQHPPVPEVIGPQSFIFLQESELDSADISQQPTPRPASPASIPSQTFTNQSFTIPQHFTPDLLPNPHIPIADIPQPVHFVPNDPNGHIPNYTTANPPPPIPMPPSHPLPPHMAIPPAQVATHPHNIPHQRLPSPSFPQPFKQQPTHPSEQGAIVPNQTDLNPEEIPQNAVVQQAGEWLDAGVENRDSGQLEIDEWKPQIETTKIDEWNPQNENSTSESTTQTNGQNDKYRPRGRGRGGSGNYRGRGNYQNGRGGSGSYYKHNDGNYQGNGNGTGRNYNDNYRENRKDGGGGGGNRYENNQGGYQDNYRGRGGSARGPRQNGGTRGTQPRGAGGPRTQYPRKPANNQYEARNGIDTNKQSFSN